MDQSVLATDSPSTVVPTGQLWAWGQNASGQAGSGAAGSDVLSSLGNGRFELPIGELSDWMPSTPTRQAIRTSAESILAPIVGRTADRTQIAHARWPPRPRGG